MVSLLRRAWCLGRSQDEIWGIPLHDDSNRLVLFFMKHFPERFPTLCGRNSVVESLIPIQDVVGSSPIARFLDPCFNIGTARRN